MAQSYFLRGVPDQEGGYNLLVSGEPKYSHTGLMIGGDTNGTYGSRFSMDVSHNMFVDMRSDRNNAMNFRMLDHDFTSDPHSLMTLAYDDGESESSPYAMTVNGRVSASQLTLTTNDSRLPTNGFALSQNMNTAYFTTAGPKASFAFRSTVDGVTPIDRLLITDSGQLTAPAYQQTEDSRDIEPIAVAGWDGSGNLVRSFDVNARLRSIESQLSALNAESMAMLPDTVNKIINQLNAMYLVMNPIPLVQAATTVVASTVAVVTTVLLTCAPVLPQNILTPTIVPEIEIVAPQKVEPQPVEPQAAILEETSPLQPPVDVPVSLPAEATTEVVPSTEVVPIEPIVTTTTTTPSPTCFQQLSRLHVDLSGGMYILDGDTVRFVSPLDEVSTYVNVAMAQYSGISMDMSGGLFLTDLTTQSVQYVDSTKAVTTIGTGFQTIGDVVYASENMLYVTDTGKHQIFSLVPSTQTVSLLAGSIAGFANGRARSAQFHSPQGIAVDSKGTIYVADTGNHAIRKIAAGIVSTVAGSGSPGYVDATGTSAKLNGPTEVIVDTDGTLYVADTGNHVIRQILPGGVVTTLVGSTSGYRDGIGKDSQLASPIGICLTGQGQIYVADTGNEMIRMVTLS